MKTLLLTGASRGIGLAIAQLFLKHGWYVIGTSTSGKAPLSHTHLKFLPLNLTSSAQIDNVVSQISSIDLLVNNAGVLLENWDQTIINMDELKATFAINVFGTIELTEKTIPKINNGGQIINISSGWGSIKDNYSPYQPNYKMSKACLNMYTRLLAERLPSLIISSFDPGWVKTDMGKSLAPTLPTETAQEVYDLALSSKPSGYFWHEGKMRSW